MTKDKEISVAERSANEQLRGHTQGASASSASSGVAVPSPAPAPEVRPQRPHTPRPPAGSGHPLAPQFFAVRIIRKN
eukprot:6813074-Alexandrium_andersonii.AAC.1